jgi:multicomponent Na+:H+ antiporter subunit F
MSFSTFVLITMLILGGTIILTFWRLYSGPSLPDRVVAMDLLSAVGVAVIAVYAIYTQNGVFLDVALVVALISFLGTVAFAYYIDQRH